jgi:biotin carboxyl carrier protein
VGTTELLLEIDGKHHQITIVQRHDTFFVAVRGETYSLTREQSAASGPQVALALSPDITAPMPGRVIQVLVKPGDAIVSGDTLLILEAMKMENRLLAEAPGIVEAVKVSRGDLVEGGQVLAVVRYDQGSEP